MEAMYPQVVTRLSTNRARHRVTLLVYAMALPLRQTTMGDKRFHPTHLLRALLLCYL